MLISPFIFPVLLDSKAFLCFYIIINQYKHRYGVILSYISLETGLMIPFYPSKYRFKCILCSREVQILLMISWEEKEEILQHTYIFHLAKLSKYGYIHS